MRLALRILAVVFGLGLLALAGLAIALRPPSLPLPEPGFRLENVTLVTPLDARVRVAHIAGAERIESIAPERGGDSREGPFVLPGLIDLHVHHPPAIAVGERQLFATLFLRYGVTSVRDMGAALPATLKHHADAIADGNRAGPRVRHCGPFLDGPPPVWPGASVIESEAQGREAVARVADAGHHCIKLYNELTPRIVLAMKDEARSVGLPVVGHLPWAASLQHMADAEVQHLMGLPWGLSGSARDAAIRRYVATSMRHGIVHTPTLVTFDRIESLRRPTHAIVADPVAQLLPRYHRELLWDPRRNPIVGGQMGTPGRIDVMRQTVSALHAAGIVVLAGTDTMNPLVVPGVALHEEIRLLSEAGLGPEAALAAATWRAGETLGIEGLGRLTEGAPADLLVFSADPTRSLDHLGSLEAVIRGGRLWSREELDAALEQAREHFQGFPYDPLSMGAASRGLDFLLSFSGGGG